MEGPTTAALRAAACAGDEAAVAQLLAAHAADREQLRTAADGEGRTLFYAAVMHGQVGTARQLHAAGCADPGRGNDTGVSPLSAAAWKGHLAAVEYLCAEHGADLDSRDVYGSAPVHAAAHGGHLEIIAALVARGADVNATTSDGLTPFFMACDRGCEGVVRYLASLPAVDISRPTHRGWTPLITAACRGHAGITACLLEELGADASATTLDGESALFGAAMYGHAEVGAALAAAAPETSIRPSLQGSTPLYVAASRGHLGFVRMLTSFWGGSGLPNAAVRVDAAGLERRIRGDGGDNAISAAEQFAAAPVIPDATEAEPAHEHEQPEPEPEPQIDASDVPSFVVAGRHEQRHWAHLSGPREGGAETGMLIADLLEETIAKAWLVEWAGMGLPTGPGAEDDGLSMATSKRQQFGGNRRGLCLEWCSVQEMRQARACHAEEGAPSRSARLVEPPMSWAEVLKFVVAAPRQHAPSSARLRCVRQLLAWGKVSLSRLGSDSPAAKLCTDLLQVIGQASARSLHHWRRARARRRSAAGKGFI